jgi:shikimate dehydrogenase
VSASATVYGLLGDPVAHSRSPRMHNAAFAALGIDAVYRPFRTAAADAAVLLRALVAAGGGGNVTVPHKELAARTVDHPSDLVRRTGACNTFWAGPEGIHGENTDVPGFLAATAHQGVLLEGARVLLLGAGGAAAAVVAALLQARAARVVVVNRSPERAAALVARFGDRPALRVAESAPVSPFEVVVNATSLGLRAGDPLPYPPDRADSTCVFLDLVYRSGGTPWVEAARAHGLRAYDGSEMLLRQAAAAFELWTEREAPLAIMRVALQQD